MQPWEEDLSHSVNELSAQLKQQNSLFSTLCSHLGQISHVSRRFSEQQRPERTLRDLVLFAPQSEHVLQYARRLRQCSTIEQLARLIPSADERSLVLASAAAACFTDADWAGPGQAVPAASQGRQAQDTQSSRTVSRPHHASAGPLTAIGQIRRGGFLSSVSESNSKSGGNNNDDSIDVALVCSTILDDPDAENDGGHASPVTGESEERVVRVRKRQRPATSRSSTSSSKAPARSNEAKAIPVRPSIETLGDVAFKPANGTTKRHKTSSTTKRKSSKKKVYKSVIQHDKKRQAKSSKNAKSTVQKAAEAASSSGDVGSIAFVFEPIEADNKPKFRKIPKLKLAY